MGYIILALVLVGLVTLAVSYFKEDRVKQMESQLEENSIAMMQELYKVKKKIRVLEEEVMIGDRDNFKG
ncbi:hypothetical protein EWH99_11285 [Sporolactobacillus sp. THM7-7]|nr:hypothetical protein EWH99_11285 [Sporolactobacillus sp. THM7-7]